MAGSSTADRAPEIAKTSTVGRKDGAWRMRQPPAKGRQACCATCRCLSGVEWRRGDIRPPVARFLQVDAFLDLPLRDVESIGIVLVQLGFDERVENVVTQRFAQQLGLVGLLHGVEEVVRQ